MKKKLLATLLCTVMALGSVSGSVAAAETEPLTVADYQAILAQFNEDHQIDLVIVDDSTGEFPEELMGMSEEAFKAYLEENLEVERQPMAVMGDENYFDTEFVLEDGTTAYANKKMMEIAEIIGTGVCDNMDWEAYENILAMFNEMHDCKIIFTPEEDLLEIGSSVEEMQEFYMSMTSMEFFDYLYEIYDDILLTNEEFDVEIVQEDGTIARARSCDLETYADLLNGTTDDCEPLDNGIMPYAESTQKCYYHHNSNYVWSSFVWASVDGYNRYSSMQSYGYILATYPGYKLRSCSCSLINNYQTAFCTYTCTKWESKYAQVEGTYYVYAYYKAGGGDLT